VRRLAFVTDIVTPYTVAVMGELSRLVDLTVLFSAVTGARGCPWTFDDLSFDHRLIGGLAVKRANPEVSDYYVDPRILFALRRVHPDVIISAGWSVPTWYAALYCRLVGSPLVIQSDGTTLTERSLNTMQRASRSVLVRVAAGFAANSRQAARRFLDLGAPPETIHAAPHSTRLEPYWAVGRRRLEERPATAPAPRAGALRVLVAGRLVPRKGFEAVVRAVAHARRVEPGIRLSIAGSGPDEQRLRDLARELEVPVHFAGFVDQPELASVCARADVFVFPSTQDEFGFVLLEALAAGLACVASPFAGATEDLIVPGENGLVVDAREHEPLGQVLVALARDPAMRRRLGERGHRSALERTPRRTAEGYMLAAEAAWRRRAQAHG
jgi:glycosyltransferase involved in cell wall biosynthesis